MKSTNDIKWKMTLKPTFFLTKGMQKTEYTLEKDAYYSDETITITSRFDNSECKKDINEVII